MCSCAQLLPTASPGPNKCACQCNSRPATTSSRATFSCKPLRHSSWAPAFAQGLHCSSHQLPASMCSADWSSEHDIICVFVVQRMPWHACICSAVAGLALIYAIQSPRGTTWFHTTPQGSCIILAAVGSAACVLYTVLIPCMTRHMLGLVRLPVLLDDPDSSGRGAKFQGSKLRLLMLPPCDCIWHLLRCITSSGVFNTFASA